MALTKIRGSQLLDNSVGVAKLLVDANLDFKTFKITNLGAGVNPSDAATMAQLSGASGDATAAIAAAKAEAIAAAAADATAKDSVVASNAAADATTKANAAQAAAIAAAATDATTKANAAQAAAIAAAATDATTKANAAEANAIAAAALDATTKANTAESNAIAAAATDATTKANAAQAAAISAAATDATTKANAAQAAAISAAVAADVIVASNAASDATTKANAAQAAAIAAAATDATTKANAAQAAAISAAATDATTKANAVEAALSANIAQMVNGLFPKAAVAVATGPSVTGMEGIADPLPTCTYADGSDVNYLGIGATLTATANGPLVIDGFSDFVEETGTYPTSHVAGTRVLVRGQADPAENGIYTVVAKGAVDAPWVLRRAAGCDGAPQGEVQANIYCYTLNVGATRPNMGYMLGGANPMTVGSTELVWGIYQNLIKPDVNAGDGIAITGLANTGEITVNIDRANFYDSCYVKFGTPSGAVNNTNTDFVFDAKMIQSTVNVMLNGNIIEGGIADNFTGQPDWDYRIDAANHKIVFAVAPKSTVEGADKVRYSGFKTL